MQLSNVYDCEIRSSWNLWLSTCCHSLRGRKMIDCLKNGSDRGGLCESLLLIWSSDWKKQINAQASQVDLTLILTYVKCHAFARTGAAWKCPHFCALNYFSIQHIINTLIKRPCGSSVFLLFPWYPLSVSHYIEWNQAWHSCLGETWVTARSPSVSHLCVEDEQDRLTRLCLQLLFLAAHRALCYR